MSKVILQPIKYETNLIGGAYVQDLVECENCAVNDPFCDIHDIYGVEWCSLGRRKGDSEPDCAWR